MANQEHVDRLKKGSKVWNQWRKDNSETKPDLGSAHLIGIDISSANLSESNLSDTNLRAADLRAADLSYANLVGANLIGANLKSANLSSANLIGANLSSANLSRTDLSRADLRATDLRATDLRAADLSSVNLKGADLSHANLSSANLSSANFRDTNLSSANLSSANLSSANLIGANLSSAIIDEETQLDDKWRLVWRIVNEGAEGADLSSTDLSYADLKDTNLSGAIFSGTNLSGAIFKNADLSHANFRGAIIDEETQLDDKWRLVWRIVNEGAEGADLSSTDLSYADLKDTNLSGAIFSGANLSDANLSGANLSGANLKAVQALGTNFQSAILAGTCIEDWGINSRTNLQDVICEYIFTQHDREMCQFTNRRPHDPNQIFAPGEFTKRYQVILESVDLFFNDGIDWKAFLASLNDLQTQYGDELSIRDIGKRSGGTFLVQLEIPSDADKAAIERTAKERYEANLKIVEAQHHAELQELKIQYGDEIITLYRRHNAQMEEITKLLASKPITVEAKAVAESQSNSETYSTDLRGATVGNFANKVQDNAHQQTNQHIYASPKKQSLADAAQEIQKLLKILEQTNPAATEADQKAFVTAATPPTVKQRAVSALQSGGKAAIEGFLDNAYVNVAIAIIEGWRDAGANQ